MNSKSSKYQWQQLTATPTSKLKKSEKRTDSSTNFAITALSAIVIYLFLGKLEQQSRVRQQNDIYKVKKGWMGRYAKLFLFIWKATAEDTFW